MADGMEDLKLTVNKDFAVKLHKQKEKAELDQCEHCDFLLKDVKFQSLTGNICSFA